MGDRDLHGGMQTFPLVARNWFKNILGNLLEGLGNQGSSVAAFVLPNQCRVMWL